MHGCLDSSLRLVFLGAEAICEPHTLFATGRQKKHGQKLKNNIAWKSMGCAFPIPNWFCHIFLYIYLAGAMLFFGGVGWCLGVCSEKPWLEDNALGFHSALFILVLKRCCACSCIYCVEPSLATKVTLQWKTQEGTIWEKQPNALTDLINYRFYRKSCE